MQAPTLFHWGSADRFFTAWSQGAHRLMAVVGCQCRNKTPAILPVLPIINLGGDVVGTLQ
jgi:hypothetical protein